uniref:Prolactin receptor n=1 Tax=Gasterosteus aculeatus aculeatus TaxID=481459 RepID=A0AAQ4Q1T6_GASAC
MRLKGVTNSPRMRRGFGVALLFLLLLLSAESNSTSPPGKPVLLGCRSPDKETFTCWWEPGTDGGLPTTHRLHYERERLEGTHECPDYRSAGRNSCFFDKEHTSIWVDYFLTVTACNALGNASSEPYKMDVMEIVKPDALDNVTLLVEKSDDSPLLHIRWEPPSNTDIKSGWVTVKYELRVRQDTGNKWAEYTSGTQTHFSLYSIVPGSVYTVQVRCRLDHGSWSEWSNSTCVEIPNYHHKEAGFWLMVSILSAIPFITAVSILVVKRKSVKQWVLPPVPGPKIRDIDAQLLNRGGSEAVDNVLLVMHSFHSIRAWKEPMEEYLIVTENDDNPPSSLQKRNKSFLILAGFNLDHEKLYSEDTTESQRERETDDERTAETDHSAVDGAVEPFTNSSYVDVQRHVEAAQARDEEPVDYSKLKEVNGEHLLISKTENVSLGSSGYVAVKLQGHLEEDYSRVQEVDGDNVVTLQTQTAAVDALGRAKGNHYAECPLQKTGKAVMCADLVQSGYVDTTRFVHI